MYGKQYGGYRYWQGFHATWKSLKVLEFWNWFDTLKVLEKCSWSWKVLEFLCELYPTQSERSKNSETFRIKLLMLWNNYEVLEGYKPCTNYRDRHTVYTHWSSSFLFRYHFLVNSFRNESHHIHHKVIRDQIRLRDRINP